MSPTPPNIRTCAPADLPAVAELCRRWQAEDITRNYHADRIDQLAARMGESFLVAEADGRIVGFVIAQVKPTANNESVEGAFPAGEPLYLEVQDLYVAADRRGRGVGSGLMAAALARAAAAGVRSSLVYSANKAYARTARFYERCGYRMWHITMTRQEPG
jgi:GNAT superfamily N-acetyltransferase